MGVNLTSFGFQTNGGGGGGGGSSYSLTELLVLKNSDTLPDGEWVFVTDICDDGAWLFCSSSSTIDIDGFGLFLNCDWQNVGDYTGMLAQTGQVYGGANSGLWNNSLESFTVTYSVLAGGTFAVGDAVTGTSGWNGVILSDNGVDSMTVYSTIMNLPLVGDVIGNGVVTCEATIVGQKTIGRNVVIWATPALGHRQYQCINSALTDGTNPATSPAYELLPKSATLGGILVSNRIEFDAIDGWLQARFDDAGNFWRMTKAINTLFAWGYLSMPIGYFQWGRTNYTGCKLDNCRWLAINIAVSFCFDHVCQTGASLTLVTTAATPQFAGVRLGTNSTFSATTAGESITYVEVFSNMTFSNKTVTSEIGNFYVTGNDTAIETLTYSTWTITGRRYKQLSFTSDDLLNNLAFVGIVGGFELLPAVVDSYYKWEASHEFTYKTAAYTQPSKPTFYSQEAGFAPVFLVDLPLNTLNSVNDTLIPLIQIQMTSSNVLPSTGYNQRLMYKLANNANQTIGGGNLIIKITYDIIQKGV